MSEQKIEEVFVVETRYDLDDKVKEIIKKKFPNAKKITLGGQVFVFKPLTKGEWDSSVESWLKGQARANKQVSQEEVERRIIEASVIFPSRTYPFQENIALENVFWLNQPAGSQARLVQQIEHQSGYLVPGMIKDEDVYSEDYFEQEEAERPSDEVLNNLKNSTGLPVRLVKLFNTWWVIKAMTFSEAKLARKRVLENPEGDYELDLLKNCILYGPTKFENMVAGAVTYLIQNLRDLSGLPTNDNEPMISEEAEDL